MQTLGFCRGLVLGKKNMKQHPASNGALAGAMSGLWSVWRLSPEGPRTTSTKAWPESDAAVKQTGGHADGPGPACSQGAGTNPASASLMGTGTCLLRVSLPGPRLLRENQPQWRGHEKASSAKHPRWPRLGVVTTTWVTPVGRGWGGPAPPLSVTVPWPAWPCEDAALLQREPERFQKLFPLFFFIDLHGLARDTAGRRRGSRGVGSTASPRPAPGQSLPEGEAVLFRVQTTRSRGPGTPPTRRPLRMSQTLPALGAGRRGHQCFAEGSCVSLRTREPPTSAGQTPPCAAETPLLQTSEQIHVENQREMR